MVTSTSLGNNQAHKAFCEMDDRHWNTRNEMIAVVMNYPGMPEDIEDILHSLYQKAYEDGIKMGRGIETKFHWLKNTHEADAFGG